MFHSFKGLLFLPLLACSVALHAQDTPTVAAPPVDTTTVKKTPTVIKAYKDVVTAKAVSQFGFLAVHKVDEKYYFEIPDSIFGREIMAVTRLATAPPGTNMYAGELMNSKTIIFEKGPNKNIFIRVATHMTAADSADAIYKAVKNGSVDPIVLTYDIKAYGKDNKSVVLDFTDFFMKDNVISGFSSAVKRNFKVGGVAADRSYYLSWKAFPANVEVRTMKTYSAGGAAPAGEAGGAAADGAADMGAATFEVANSMFLLPVTPMRQRLADERIGFFQDQYTVFSDNQQKVEERKFAIRFRMEPRPEDLEKYKRGELVEPAKPIVFYVDPAIPKYLVPYFIKGVNAWQQSFEQAGFKNAIVGKEWPENDTNMDMQDSRYNMIRLFPSEIPNAYGKFLHDPRSGEILSASVGFYFNVLRFLHLSYFTQAAAIDTAARHYEFSNELMGKLVQHAITHEIGHTLGLRHNMGASYAYSIDQLRNKEWVEKHGPNPSIMDYTRVNYVAQPEDKISQSGLIPHVGEYDDWTIKWGYAYHDGLSSEDEKKKLSKLTTENLAKNPALWFGGEGRNNDPRAQVEDVGNNSVEAAKLGMQNLKLVATNLMDWAYVPDQAYESIQDMYDKIGGQFLQYSRSVIANIGGIYTTIKSEAQGGIVYAPAPKSLQKESVAFLHKEVFETPTWFFNNKMLNKIRKPGKDEFATKMQESVYMTAFGPSSLLKLSLSERRFGTAVSYTVDEFLTDNENGFFSELKTNTPIDPYRRNLQKQFVATMVKTVASCGSISNDVNKAPNIFDELSDTEVPGILMYHLKGLEKKLKASASAYSDEATRSHFQYLATQINDFLAKGIGGTK